MKTLSMKEVKSAQGNIFNYDIESMQYGYFCAIYQLVELGVLNVDSKVEYAMEQLGFDFDKLRGKMFK